MTVDEQE